MIQNTTWRWVFYTINITGEVIQLIGFFFLRETYAPRILFLKAKRLRKASGDLNTDTEYEQHDRAIDTVLKATLVRPCRLLGIQPIIQILAVYTRHLYGTLFLVLSTSPMLWETYYRQPKGIAGLNYISIGLGCLLGTQICAPILDRVYVRLKARNGGVGLPEFRVPLMILGSILTLGGPFRYRWSAQYRTH
jgi:hypothetical protein